MAESNPARVRVVHPKGGELMTKHSMALDTDVNQIVKRHIQFGMPLPVGEAKYGDFSGTTDYHDALNRVFEAREQFEALPAAVRDACRNDPGVFLEKVASPEGREELGKLGLDAGRVPARVVEASPVEVGATFEGREKVEPGEGGK